MPRTTKPPPIGKELLCLAQEGAILLIYDQKARVLQGSNHKLVEQKVLQVLREKGYLEPFVEIRVEPPIIMSRISLKGRDQALWMREHDRGYTQMIFDEMVNNGEGTGDALSSLVVS
jgi:hypothetical protein